MKSIDLTIVVINYNTRDLTLACLQSIIDHTKGLNYECIVIDNHSTDGSRPALARFVATDERFRLIKSAKNLGFGRANNYVARKAKGDYILFLNSDTQLTGNAIGKALKKAKSIPRLGVYSIKLLNTDLSDQVSGGAFPNLTNLLAWQLAIDDLPLFRTHFPSVHPHHNQTRPDWVTGAFMLVSRKAFVESGGFDPKIFMYTEELELCYRLDQMGYKIVLNPDINIIHHGGSSSGSYHSLTSEVRYMLYFFEKHKSRLIMPFVKLIFILGSSLRYLYFGIIKNNAQSRKTYLQAIRLCL
jgi:N-acetylglucosaminyl-diphospho-decaprenol L-rhamnosyltransferase